MIPGVILLALNLIVVQGTFQCQIFVKLAGRACLAAFTCSNGNQHEKLQILVTFKIKDHNTRCFELNTQMYLQPNIKAFRPVALQCSTKVALTYIRVYYGKIMKVRGKYNFDCE